MLKVGLTGGIGSGKSTVAEYFARLGVVIVDADQIAKEITLPGASAYKTIIESFGSSILSPSGEIDRKKLRQIVFQDHLAKKQLENILHPRIIKEMLNKIESINAPYCIIVIPLLVETGFAHHDFLDRICVVDTLESLQIERASRRDSTAPQEILKIIKGQSSSEERLRVADDIILNNSDLISLENQIKKLHNQYLQMSSG